MMANILAWIYVAAVGLLSIYGLLGIVTLWLYWRHRDEVLDPPSVSNEELPYVTVQLPVYNERYVVERLIKSAVELDYPKGRLQIQVIDDSDDDTSEIAGKLVASFQESGVKIDHIRRKKREGYKAGALSKALDEADGEFLALFDADFQPKADFLQKIIPHFVKASDLGMIQARWGHLNAGDSSLTAAQSIALDKHFLMEQTVRHRANLFPKFNGAAGIWRRQCVEDAGGWLDDTVCEDLCLSTRAVLKGWRFQFLPEVIAPAELPVSISAYKNQQARWAKGSIQCLTKYSADILRNQEYSLAARIYALLSMSAYATHFLVLILLLLQIPLILFNVRLPTIMLLFTIAGLGQPLLFIVAQREGYKDWKRRLLHFPTLLLVAIGIAPSNSRAVVQAFVKGKHPFIRTPKGLKKGNQRIEHEHNPSYKLDVGSMWWVEILLAIYAAFGVALAFAYGNFGPMFLLLMSLLGFGYVVWLEIREVPVVLSGARRQVASKTLETKITEQDIA